MASHNLLILSDIHLGSDLIHWAQPGAPGRSAGSSRRDEDLVELLDWYSRNRRGGRPWRLVIAGDFVDLVGMSIVPEGSDCVTPPNDEERAHGLGGAPDHAILKLRRVAEHHEAVFKSLARFVAAGNALVVLRGNHDADLHWEEAQYELRRALRRHAELSDNQVEFAPWFYYEEGVVYVEHGHQYDAFCSLEHLLHPVSPRDPRRTLLSCADVLLRYVVRPTRGLTEAGHARATFLGYLRFAARLGLREMLRLAERFTRAVVALLGIWRDHFSDATAWVRREHNRKMRLLALAKDISLRRLRALARLQRPPVTRSLLAILASVMLDRVVVVMLGIAVSVLALQTLSLWWHTVLALLCVAGMAGLMMFFWSRLRSAADPSKDLRERAARVAGIFPAAFVVMGHTHLPEMRPTTGGTTTYVNLGAWAEEDPVEGFAPGLPATRTHLVLVPEQEGAVGELLVWNSGAGPQSFRIPSEATPSGDGSGPYG